MFFTLSYAVMYVLLSIITTLVGIFFVRLKDWNDYDALAFIAGVLWPLTLIGAIGYFTWMKASDVIWQLVVKFSK